MSGFSHACQRYLYSSIESTEALAERELRYLEYNEALAMVERAECLEKIARFHQGVFEQWKAPAAYNHNFYFSSLQGDIMPWMSPDWFEIQREGYAKRGRDFHYESYATWCEDNCTGQFEHRTLFDRQVFVQDFYSMFSFEDEADAILFKLRWLK